MTINDCGLKKAIQNKDYKQIKDCLVALSTNLAKTGNPVEPKFVDEIKETPCEECDYEYALDGEECNPKEELKNTWNGIINAMYDLLDQMEVLLGSDEHPIENSCDERPCAGGTNSCATAATDSCVKDSKYFLDIVKAVDADGKEWSVKPMFNDEVLATLEDEDGNKKRVIIGDLYTEYTVYNEDGEIVLTDGEPEDDIDDGHPDEITIGDANLASNTLKAGDKVKYDTKRVGEDTPIDDDVLEKTYTVKKFYDKDGNLVDEDPYADDVDKRAESNILVEDKDGKTRTIKRSLLMTCDSKKMSIKDSFVNIDEIAKNYPNADKILNAADSIYDEMQDGTDLTKVVNIMNSVAQKYGVNGKAELKDNIVEYSFNANGVKVTGKVADVKGTEWYQLCAKFAFKMSLASMMDKIELSDSKKVNDDVDKWYFIYSGDYYNSSVGFDSEDAYTNYDKAVEDYNAVKKTTKTNICAVVALDNEFVEKRGVYGNNSRNNYTILLNESNSGNMKMVVESRITKVWLKFFRKEFGNAKAAYQFLYNYVKMTMPRLQLQLDGMLAKAQAKDGLPLDNFTGMIVDVIKTPALAEKYTQEKDRKDAGELGLNTDKYDRDSEDESYDEDDDSEYTELNDYDEDGAEIEDSKEPVKDSYYDEDEDADFIVTYSAGASVSYDVDDLKEEIQNLIDNGSYINPMPQDHSLFVKKLNNERNFFARFKNNMISEYCYYVKLVLDGNDIICNFKLKDGITDEDFLSDCQDIVKVISEDFEVRNVNGYNFSVVVGKFH